MPVIIFSTKCLPMKERVRHFKWYFFSKKSLNKEIVSAIIFDFVITVDKFTEENYNNFSTAEDMSPYSAENQLKLTKALVILHIKPSTFHSYCTSGKYDRVCIQIHCIIMSYKWYF